MFDLALSLIISNPAKRSKWRSPRVHARVASTDKRIWNAKFKRIDKPILLTIDLVKLNTLLQNKRWRWCGEFIGEFD